MNSKRIIEIISEITGIDKGEITAETLLFEDIALDSLEFLKIATAIEEELDCELDGNQARDISSVNDVINWVETRK